MVRNEPSDRQDRRIQRRKMRQMWASLREEKARMELLPGRNPKTVHYIGRDGVDVTDEVMPKVWIVIGAFAVLMLILAVTA